MKQLSGVGVTPITLTPDNTDLTDITTSVSLPVSQPDATTYCVRETLSPTNLEEN